MINMTIEDLKDRIKDLPGDMPVIIPAVDEDDPDHLLCFYHVRTVGILSSEYDTDALCLSAVDKLNISEQIENSENIGDYIKCEKVLF